MNPPVNQCLNFSRGCILYHEYCGKEVFSAAFHAVFYIPDSKIALKIGFFRLAGAKSPCRQGKTAHSYPYTMATTLLSTLGKSDAEVNHRSQWRTSKARLRVAEDYLRKASVFQVLSTRRLIWKSREGAKRPPPL
jgi:hypothetical protein